jgi:hypothetical protein
MKFMGIYSRRLQGKYSTMGQARCLYSERGMGKRKGRHERILRMHENRLRKTFLNYKTGTRDRYRTTQNKMEKRIQMVK